MSEPHPEPSPQESSTVSRRNVLRIGAAGAVAAWSVPVILTLQASPAGAASAPPTDSTSPQTQPSNESSTSTPTTRREATSSSQPEATQVTQPETTGSTSATTGGTQPLVPPPTEGGVKPGQVSVPVPTVSSTTSNVQVRAEEVAAAPANTPSNGGLAFTGAEIGGLVVLGTGAVALGTAAVWSARNRDEDDEGTPA